MACNSHSSEFVNTYYSKQFTFLGVLAPVFKHNSNQNEVKTKGLSLLMSCHAAVNIYGMQFPFFGVLHTYYGKQFTFLGVLAHLSALGTLASKFYPDSVLIPSYSNFG
jgi:hypothetical protein